MADPSALRVVVLGRSFYGLHGFGGLERHLYDLVRHHLAEGWRVTVITRTPRDDRRRGSGAMARGGRTPGLRCPLRGLPHVPAGGPRRHDDSRSEHGVPVVRATRRQTRSGSGRRGHGGHRLRRRRQRLGLRAGATRRRHRAAGPEPARARGVRRHGRIVRRPCAQERRLRAAARGGPRLRHVERRGHRHRPGDRAQRPAAPARRPRPRPPDSQRHRRRRPRTAGRSPLPAGPCAPRPASPTTRRCW